MKYKFITTDEPEYWEERKLRANVLRKPLGLNDGAEVFPFEDEAMHLVAIDDGKVIGCVMFKPEQKTGRMLQMAIIQHRQKNGIGTQLVKVLEDRLRKDGFDDIYLHAREPAVPFYERLGYEIEGEPFLEVGLRHRHMRKIL
jgi:ribosomal protein S18 acetylase RimI-like enzyme